ncbi:MAG: hypothetical protein KG075_03900 [Alphaproteobacteria bacterium]|nr:hypothetical protein [Alphaproteobacteria bacterium]
MICNARAAGPSFPRNDRNLAEVWGLQGFSPETFFVLVEHKTLEIRQQVIAAGHPPSVMNMLAVHHETMVEDSPVDIAVMAALTWAATRLAITKSA